MRVLMTAQPGWGHLHPMIPVARALAAAGHEVRLATSRPVVPALRRLGLDAVAAGPSWEVSGADAIMPGFLRGRAGGQVRTLARLAGRGMVDDLLALAADWRPEVVVRDAYEFGGMVAARRLGVPLVVHGITIPAAPELLQAAAGEPLAKLRERYGLPPDPELRDAFADRWLSFFPPSFAPPDVTPPPVEHHLRPLLFDRSGDEVLPGWELEGPVVYATLGTVFNRHEVVFDRIVEALRDEPVTLVMTVGRDGDPGRWPAAPNLRVARYVPQSLLLDRVDAVVTHGGFNTVMAALSHGIPVCCLPLSTDHPANAERCVALGAGTACVTRRPEGLTAEMIRDAVRPLLHAPAHRAAAQAVQREIATLPGVDEAVRLITGAA